VENILAQEKVVYGVTTGFGRFSDVLISRKTGDTLQENIIMSHACGVGEPLPHEVVRAMMLLRRNSLTKGFSGVRIEVVELLLNMLNKEIHPVVPGKGSVGASGDLIPLAHIALP
jgi:histidine ammonia-lyase